MRILSLVAALSILPSAIAAQNFVTNGDFAAGLTGWTETGFSVAPGIESFDVTGLGASQCYGAGHGGQTAPAPYPPNSIKQQIIVAAGLPYEFSMDICVNRTVLTTNADAGTFYVQVGGVEVARVALGGYATLEFARARLTSRFVSNQSGPLDLEIFMHRNYTASTTTPRARIDNISVSIAPGPVFVWQGTRKVNVTRTIGADGEPNAPYAFLIAGGRTGGIALPPIQGTLFLDPTSIANFFGGAFDAQGRSRFALPVPNDPALTAVVLYVQGGHLSGGSLVLGTDQFLQFQ